MKICVVFNIMIKLLEMDFDRNPLTSSGNKAVFQQAQVIKLYIWKIKKQSF